MAWSNAETKGNEDMQKALSDYSTQSFGADYKIVQSLSNKTYQDNNGFKNKDNESIEAVSDYCDHMQMSGNNACSNVFSDQNNENNCVNVVCSNYDNNLIYDDAGEVKCTHIVKSRNGRDFHQMVGEKKDNIRQLVEYNGAKNYCDILRTNNQSNLTVILLIQIQNNIMYRKY